MTETSIPLSPAEEAVGRGDWTAALDELRRGGPAATASAEGLELGARAAYGAGDLEGAVTAYEELHRRHAEAGDGLGAARAAATVAMYLMMDTGLMAPVRAWLGRADQLLAREDETTVHATVAMVRAYERFMSGDMAAAATWADRAVDLGTRHGVRPAVALGRVAGARVRILDGHVEEGLEVLDDVAVMILSGELDALTTGMVWCELICAMQGLALYDRAEEWTDAMERWRHGTAFGGINGRCRVHRAEILRLRGSCEEAEQEALHACEALRPWMRREFGWPLTELGTIRLRKGDLAGAEEAFLAAHASAWDPQPGLALLRLTQGDVPAARALIENALERPQDVPSKERPPFGPLRRAPLLEAYTEIAAAAGDEPVARSAADELSAIAASFGSAALTASASLARARVALLADDAVTAVYLAESAVNAWADMRAPYEAAVGRMLLGRAHRASGNETCARLEWQTARSEFERLGSCRFAAELAGWLDGSPPAVAPRTAGPVAGGSVERTVFRCDGDTRTITFDGQTVLLRDLKGLRYLARLLAEPGREFHVLDLVAVERGVLPRGATVSDVDGVHHGGDAGPLLDDRARDAYRRRLADIEEDIEEATQSNDLERVARAEADRDYLVRELARAVGFGGRQRRAGSTSERARSSVTRSLRYALARVREHHAALGTHLDQTIQTGTYCAYTPDPRVPITWDVE